MSSPDPRRLVPAAVAAAIGAAALIALTAAAPAGSAGSAGSQRTLSVTVQGSGAVRTADRRIGCGTRCTTRYPTGREVTLTAVPQRDFAFRAWTTGCVGAAPTCVVTMDAATTVRAVFEREPERVDVTVGGPGTVLSGEPGIACGAPTATVGFCVATFGRGSTLRLTAAPAPGAVLASWQGACENTAGDVCEISVGRFNQVSATFRAVAPAEGSQQLSVQNGPKVTSTPAAIDCPGTCSAALPSGTTVTLQAQSSAAWGGACVGAVPSCTLVVDGPTEVRVLHLVRGNHRGSHALNVALGGARRGGRVVSRSGLRCAALTPTCTKIFPFGARVTLTAVPAARHVFKRWIGPPGCERSRSRTCPVLIRGQRDVTAVFGRARR